MQALQKYNDREYHTFILLDQKNEIGGNTITVRKDSIYSYLADRSDSPATITTPEGTFTVTMSPYDIQKMITRHITWRQTNGR